MPMFNEPFPNSELFTSPRKAPPPVRGVREARPHANPAQQAQAARHPSAAGPGRTPPQRSRPRPHATPAQQAQAARHPSAAGPGLLRSRPSRAAAPPTPYGVRVLCPERPSEALSCSASHGTSPVSGRTAGRPIRIGPRRACSGVAPTAAFCSLLQPDCPDCAAAVEVCPGLSRPCWCCGLLRPAAACCGLARRCHLVQEGVAALWGAGRVVDARVARLQQPPRLPARNHAARECR